MSELFEDVLDQLIEAYGAERVAEYVLSKLTDDSRCRAFMGAQVRDLLTSEHEGDVENEQD